MLSVARCAVRRGDWVVMAFRSVFDQIFTLESAIAAGVFVLVASAVLVAVIISRARRGSPPFRRSNHQPLEASYALVLLGFAIFLAIFTAAANGREHRESADPPVVRVDVTGFQWCWRFHYASLHKTITAPCTERHLPTLVVPAGQPVRLTLTSTDVIHSFWVPALRFKLDAFPHHTNSFTLTVDKPGRWIGRCAEFCGDGHSTMDFYLRAVPRDQFASWSHQQT